MKPVQGERNSPRPSSKVIKKTVSAMLLCNNAFGSSNMMEKEIKCISTCEQPCTTATLVERGILREILEGILGVLLAHLIPH